MYASFTANVVISKKKNPCRKECAVLRILSPGCKGPAKFNRQQTPQTTTGVGGGNAPHQVENHQIFNHQIFGFVLLALILSIRASSRWYLWHIVPLITCMGPAGITLGVKHLLTLSQIFWLFYSCVVENFKVRTT